MTRTVKKALAVFLLLCLVAAWLPAAALAAQEAPTKIETVTTEPTEPKAGDTITVITLTVDKGAFTTPLDSAGTLFTITGEAAAAGITNASVQSADVQENTKQVKLTVQNCTPTKSGSFTVTVQPRAFAEAQPEQALVSDAITVKAADAPSAVAVSGSVVMGAEKTFTVKATGANFKTGLSDTNKFTLEGGGVTQPSKVSVETDTATLTVKATAAGPIKVTSIAADAFEFEPEQAVTSPTISGEVTVTAPSGNVTAKLDGGTLYAGTPAGDTKIKLTATGEGLIFANNVNTRSESFTIKGNGMGNLNVTAVTRDNDTEVTLTLSGTPTQAGAIQVEIAQAAFQYQPTGAITADGVTITAAPEVQLTGTAITAGNTNKVTINIQGESVAKFASSPNNEKFTITGDGFDALKVTNVNITGENKTAELTLDATPTATGPMTVKVAKDAFEPVASKETSATVTVSQPSGKVTAALNGSLTAGTAAGDTTITLTADGTLNFKKDSTDTTPFSLNNANGLSIKSVSYTDNQHVDLTLEGTPAAGGKFTVSVAAAAFEAAPSDAPLTTGELDINYPEITLEAAPNTFMEGHENPTFTVTATHGTFKALSGPGGGSGMFSITGNGNGLSMGDVTASASSAKADVVLSGTPNATGDITITIKKEAFTYSPEANLTVTITIGEPNGDISAKLQGGELYAGTAVSGQTIKVSETSGELIFADNPAADAFTLGTGSDGLTVESVQTVDGKDVILTLSGTPTKAGTFTVTAKTTAFKYPPKQDITSTEFITIGQANVKLTVGANTLQAGKADGSVTVTLTGSAFAADLSGKITLNTGDFSGDGLTLGDVKVDGTSVTVTVKGTPSIAGNITLTFDKTAFDPAPAENITVTVPVAKGEQTAVPETESGAPGIGLTAPVDELASAVLSPEDQELYEKGAEVKIELVESPGTQVPASDKTAVEAVAGEYTVGEYLDVSLIKTINGTSDAITETNKPIQVVFTIPTDLRAADREFAVIRVHDGKAEFLKTVASTADTITVESDLFSTYAIVYQSKPEESPAPDDTPAPDSTPAPDDTGDRAPDTGDATPIMGWLALLLSCGAALILVLASKRRREH